MFKLLRYFTKKDWLFLAIALVFIVAGVWMDISIPSYLGRITSLVTSGYYYFDFPGSPNNIPAVIGDVWRYGGIMMAYVIGSVLTAIVVALFGALISGNHSARVRKAMFEKVNDFSRAEINKFNIASLITRATGDVTQVQSFLGLVIQMLIRVPIMIVWVIVRMTTARFELSLVTIIAIGSMIVVVAIILLFCLPQFKRIRDYTDIINRDARENLTGVRVVRAYNASGHEEAKFDNSNKKLVKSNLTMNRAMGVAMPFMTLIMSALTAAIYWVAASLLNSGSIAPYAAGDFFADTMTFMQYSFQIVGSFMMLIFLFTMLPGAVVSAKRINEVLATKSSVTENVKAGIDLKTAFEQDGTIKFNNVDFSYEGAQESVLSKVNIEITKGQTVAFIGSTGSGKSTLVNLLPRIIDPIEGEVLIGGVNIKDVSFESLNDMVGYIPQSPIIFSGTVKDNVALGNVDGTEITKESIDSAVNIAQADEFIDGLDNGIEAEVKQRGRNFSGGQKQRLSIARTLARKSPIIIFDDTFSALDYKTDKNLRNALKTETSDATVLIVAQRIGTIKNADQIFVLDHGQVVGTGTHAELLKNCEVYKQIALSQLSEKELEVA